MTKKFDILCSPNVQSSLKGFYFGGKYLWLYLMFTMNYIKSAYLKTCESSCVKGTSAMTHMKKEHGEHEHGGHECKVEEKDVPKL